MNGNSCLNQCSNGVCNSLNTSCICNEASTRPIEFVEMVFSCEPNIKLYTFSVLLMYTFSLLTAIILGLITTSCYNNKFFSTPKNVNNHFIQLIVLLTWSCIKIAEFSCLHLLNRFYIVTRILFWISQLLAALLHGLEITAYLNVFFNTEKNSLNPPLLLNEQEQKNVHDSFWTPNGRCILFIVLLVILTIPFTGLLLTTSLTQWSSFGQIIMASCIVFIYCTSNFIITWILKRVLKQKKKFRAFRHHYNRFRDSIPLLALCMTTSLVTIICEALNRTFIAECFIASTEIIMFLRFLRIFWVSQK